MILILILITTILLWKFFKYQQLYQTLKSIPGPKGHPIIGSMLEYCTTPPEKNFQMSLQRSSLYYPGPWAIWLGMTPIVIFQKASHVEIILKGLMHNSSKGSVYKFMEPWLGRSSLITAHGSEWRSHRKLLTPTFHFKILKEFHNIIVEKAEIFVNRLQSKCQNKEVFDILPFISQCTLDVICETAMGVSVDAQIDGPNEYRQAIIDISNLVLERQFNFFYHYDFIWKLTKAGKREQECLKILHGFTDKVIQQRKQVRQLKQQDDLSNNETKNEIGVKKVKPFLDLMLDSEIDGRSFTDKEIRDETNTFLFAGHDTSAASIAWTLFLLGNHPEIQEKVYKELENIFQNSDRQCTSDDLAKMKYLEMCIKESLRLYPSVPRIIRILEEDINLDGKIVPKGIAVVAHIYQLHHDPENFANPEVFNPDNFLPENVAKRHPFSFIPFSAGPRNCIGQKFALLEIKIVLSTFLRKYKVVATQKPSDINLSAFIILQSKDGIRIRLEPRI